ncbi:MAG: DUF799 domain-containing protein [Mediterranea sp.]|jgi:hypothetical protein|nr:DUF799 domain-containing protein [Mediterranea sp.]
MKKVVLLALAALALTSYTATAQTRGERYPGMYEEKPQTIVIMPPINRTTHAEAKDYFYTTLYMPLCEKGYYVYSPSLTMELFQQESGYDAERFIEGDLTTFRDVLGADAAMFTIIKDWSRLNALGLLTVDIEYILRSTKTGQTLYHREGEITIDKSFDETDEDGNKKQKGFGEMMMGLVMNAINTAATDKIVAGRECSSQVLSDLPVGKYSSRYEQDAGDSAGPDILVATIKKL